MAKSKVDVTYGAGFLICRLVTVDESSGSEHTVPGLHARIRCSDVCVYNQSEEGTLELFMRGTPEASIYVIGSLTAMDKAMARDAEYLRLVDTTAT